MSERVVAEIRKNNREVIRVALKEYEGRDICSVRVWYEAEDGTMRPGKDGLAFKVELLPEIAEAVSAAVRSLAGAPKSGRRSSQRPSRRSLNS